MSKRKKSKHKVDRKIGENLWNSNKSPLNKGRVFPGQHAKNPKSKFSDYYTQLYAKQKLKYYYCNINESQLFGIFKKALGFKGNVTENFIGLLESRLDVIIYRAKFAPTLYASRQIINHGHILVNNIKVNISSYNCSINDKISIKFKSKKLSLIKDSIKINRKVPNYIYVNLKLMYIILIYIPKLCNVPYEVKMMPHLITELYSK